MALRLTPVVLRSAYDFLCVTPPFRRWHLPPSSEVTFLVSRTLGERGHYDCRRGRHTIWISERNSGHTVNVIATMAHEMVHLHQAHSKLPGRRVEHGREFHRLAAQVCRHHGFDEKAF